MARYIEPGQELSQEDYAWLKDRGRVDEALDIWGCTLAEGVGDDEEPRTSEPVVAPTISDLQTEEPPKAPEPGTFLSVHPDQVGFIAGTEGEVSTEDAEADDEVPPYEEWDKADLEAEVARRNEGRDEDDQIVPEGTGKSGGVVKADLVTALEADDEAASE